MKTIIIFLLLVALGLGSCTHKSSNDFVYNDYMIIGQTGGFAGPVAMTSYYLISGGQLREDNSLGINKVPDDPGKFNFSILLPTARYDYVKDLLITIPPELLAAPSGDIGAPWPDAGYTDVRASLGGKVYKWHFEADQSRSSATVRQFLQHVQFLFR